MEYRPPIALLVEYRNWETPMDSYNYAIGDPAKMGHLFRDIEHEITRVLLCERTQRESDAMKVMYKEEVWGLYLREKMYNNPKTTNPN